MSNPNVLVQHGVFKGERRFEIRHDRYVSVCHSSPRGKTEYRLDLVGISPLRQVRLSLAWKCLTIALLSLGLLLLILFILPEQLESILPGLSLGLAAGLAVLTLVFTILTIARSRLEHVYCSTYANYPLIRLLKDKPDPRHYGQFTDWLQACIEQLNETIQLDEEKRIAGEIKMFRRLLKHRVLNKKDYERIKRKLLTMTND